MQHSTFLGGGEEVTQENNTSSMDSTILTNNCTTFIPTINDGKEIPHSDPTKDADALQVA
jgi:hypothetical protein